MNANTITLSNQRLRGVAAACATVLLTTVTAAQQGAQGEDPAVTVTDYDTVDLAVQDTDLGQVLQMLSIQSEKNIISGSGVSATVTANLFDVTFYEALDAILRVNGYRYTEEGNFIYIWTEAEYLEQLEASRQTEQQVFTLDYLSAADAHDFALPLLSDAGSSSFKGDVQPGYAPSPDDGGGDNWAYGATIVIYDYPENLEAIGALLAELDIPPMQVLVESTIVQTTLDEANAFGIDFSVIGNVNFTDLTSPLSLVDNLLAGDDPTNGFQPDDNNAAGSQSTVGNTAGAGGLKVGIVTNDISVFLRVLDEVTDTTILARPKVMALNRQRAEVLVGARVGYLSTTATETTTTQSVEFLDTGIHLVFRPFISNDGMIRMELSPSVSEASLRTVTDANGLQVTIPDELTNEITTNVRVKDGETLVLGGLFRESTRNTRRQVPLLGDIPLVGAAFRGHEDTVDRDEIIFLITPTIMQDNLLWAMGVEALAYTDNVRVGARAGLLPFSREKMTVQQNQEAHAAFAKGDIQKALYHANNSLRLNPNQPEMITFRQKLTGSKKRPHERSMLQRAFNTARGEDADALHTRHFDRGYQWNLEPQNAIVEDNEQVAGEFTKEEIVGVHEGETADDFEWEWDWNESEGEFDADDQHFQSPEMDENFPSESEQPMSKLEEQMFLEQFMTSFPGEPSFWWSPWNEQQSTTEADNDSVDEIEVVEASEQNEADNDSVDEVEVVEASEQSEGQPE